MKRKNILHNLTKIPLLCLITVTVFLSDSIYDGILPWPSPFHITLGYTDHAFQFSADWNWGRPAKVRMDAPEPVLPADGNVPLEKADASTANDIFPEPDGGNGVSDSDIGNKVPDSDGSDTAFDPDGSGAVPHPDSSDTASDPNGSGAVPHPDSSDTASDPDGGGAVPHPDDKWGQDPGGADEPADTDVALGEDGLPLVSYIQVEDDYFDDAVFIGDSRTRSLQLYAGLENTTFLADTGLTIYTVLDKTLMPSTSNSKTTVTDYLTQHQFRKIYLMLGINELGTGTAESFCRSYSEVLDQLRELQPDAIIYLQAILHISESKDKEHTYINNAAIIERNEALKSLADNEHIFWLDSNPAVCDENGYLLDSYTFDGVHLQAKYVYLLTDYLKQHAVKVNTPPYQPSFTPQPRAIP